MSRTGKLPIVIPKGVEIKIAGSEVSVKGPKGRLSRRFRLDNLSLENKDGVVQVKRNGNAGPTRALHGMTRAMINNMVVGVTTGYAKVLEITGVGHKASVAGKKLTLNVGYSHPVEFEAPEGVQIEIEKDTKVKPKTSFDNVDIQTKISITGIDKEKVGQIAANIRKSKGAEPYKGKGVRYSGERIIRKVGKRGK